MKFKFPKPFTPNFWGFLFISFFFFAMCFLAGCDSTPITLTEPMVYCTDGLGKSVLTEPCDKTAPLTTGSNYETGLKGKKNSDASLGLCASKTSTLQAALAECDKKVAEHNAALAAMNKK